MTFAGVPAGGWFGEGSLIKAEARKYDVVALRESRVALFNPQLYPGVGPSFRLSQEEIGYLSGISRQRANQALRVLEQAGLLHLEYGGVTVKTADGLRRYEG